MNMHFEVIITLCFFLTVQTLKNLDATEKIFHASNIKSEVLIKTYNADGTFRRYCGGAVIQPRFILSAFICIDGSPKHDIAIGSDKVTEDGNTKWIQSDCYTDVMDIDYFFKLALLVFNNPINDGNVEIAKLPTSGSDVNADDAVYVATYSTYGMKNLVPELDLVISKYKVEDRRKCMQKYRALVNDVVFCYYTEEEHTSLVDFAAPVYGDNETVVGIEFYRDEKECTESRPILNYRLGHARIQLFINNKIQKVCN